MTLKWKLYLYFYLQVCDIAVYVHCWSFTVFWNIFVVWRTALVIHRIHTGDRYVLVALRNVTGTWSGDLNQLHIRKHLQKNSWSYDGKTPTCRWFFQSEACDWLFPFSASCWSGEPPTPACRAVRGWEGCLLPCSWCQCLHLWTGTTCRRKEKILHHPSNNFVSLWATTQWTRWIKCIYSWQLTHVTHSR